MQGLWGSQSPALRHSDGTPGPEPERPVRWKPPQDPLAVRAARALRRHQTHLKPYARVSSVGQNLSVQLEKLTAAGIEPEDIFKEKRTGTDRGRPELQRCIAYVHKGDTLLVTKIDRLARSTSDLYGIISQLQTKGVRVSGAR